MTTTVYPHDIRSTVGLSVASPLSDLLNKPLGLLERGVPDHYGISLQDIVYVAKRDDGEPDLDYFAGRLTFIANNLEGHAGVTPECNDPTRHVDHTCAQVCDLEDVRYGGDERLDISGQAIWQASDGSHSLVELLSVTTSGISKVILPVGQKKSITALVFPPRPTLLSGDRKAFKNRRQNLNDRRDLRNNAPTPEGSILGLPQRRRTAYDSPLNGALQGFLVEKGFRYRDVSGIDVEILPVQYKGEI